MINLHFYLCKNNKKDYTISIFNSFGKEIFCVNCSGYTEKEAKRIAEKTFLEKVIKEI